MRWIAWGYNLVVSGVVLIVPAESTSQLMLLHTYQCTYNEGLYVWLLTACWATSVFRIISVCLWRSVSTTGVHGPSSRAELTARVLGPWTRAVNSGSGNRPWDGMTDGRTNRQNHWMFRGNFSWRLYRSKLHYLRRRSSGVLHFSKIFRTQY